LKIRAFSLLVLGFALWAGCSDGGEGGGGAAAGDCGSVAASYCQKLNSCLPFAINATYGETSRCELAIKLSCEKEISAPGTKDTAGRLASCASSLAGLSCEQYQTTLFLGGSRPEACEGVPGDLADGTTCYVSAQCKSRACAISGADGCGVCKTRAAAGEPCSGVPCDTGLYCATGTCAKRKAAGEKCQSDGECLDELECSGDVCGTPGRKKVGEACDSKNKCDTFAGLACNAQGTCAAITLAAAGESCGAIDGKLVSCAASGNCDNGKCVVAVKDGGACDKTKKLDCLEPAECIEGTCKLPSAPVCK